MHIVEVRRDGDALAEPMGEMRDWLDRHRVVPTLFTMSFVSAGVVFRLEFRNASDALIFARAFHGSVTEKSEARAA